MYEVSTFVYKTIRYQQHVRCMYIRSNCTKYEVCLHDTRIIISSFSSKYRVLVLATLDMRVGVLGR